MKLNLKERFIIVNMIPVPEKGSFDTYSTIDALRTLLYPSEKEVVEFEIKSNTVDDVYKVNWNEKGLEPSDIKFTKHQVQFLLDIFTKVSDSEELTEEQYYVFKKIKESKH